VDIGYGLSLPYIYPRRELFANFEELDGGLMSIGDDQTLRLVGKDIVRVKILMGW